MLASSSADMRRSLLPQEPSLLVARGHRLTVLSSSSLKGSKALKEPELAGRAPLAISEMAVRISLEAAGLRTGVFAQQPWIRAHVLCYSAWLQVPNVYLNRFDFLPRHLPRRLDGNATAGGGALRGG